MTLEELLRQGKSFGQGASNAAASTVTGPVDMLAWLLRKGGVPVGDTPIGGEAWMRQKGLMATPENRLAGLLGEGAGLAAPIVAAAKAPQIARGLLSLDDHAMDMARKGIEGRMVSGGLLQPATVWHGSPHKFDKFDSSKIGTGEGAQAYGHGLYLAENPKVATEYSKMGSAAGGPIPSPLRFINGQEVQPGTGAYKAASLLDSMSVSQAKKTVNGWLQSARPDEAAYFKEVSDTLAGIGSKAAVKQKPPGGSLYKVDLPDDAIAKMLDWDKPLSQQSPETVAALRNGYKQSFGVSDRYLDDLLQPHKSIGEAIGGGQMSKIMTENLQRQGIPGIRYLDGGSRSAGAGSSNFVVFPGNEGLLKILERNGGKP